MRSKPIDGSNLAAVQFIEHFVAPTFAKFVRDAADATPAVALDKDTIGVRTRFSWESNPRKGQLVCQCQLAESTRLPLHRSTPIFGNCRFSASLTLALAFSNP